MKKQLFIFPYGGNGLEALDCLSRNFDLLGFIDDDPRKQGLNDLGIEVFSREVLHDYPEAYMLAVNASVTSFKSRHTIIRSFDLFPNPFATLVHHSAQISNYAHIGKNCLVMANVVIAAKVKIGNHVIILPNTTIHHETEVGDYAWIGSQVVLAGNVRLGSQCWIASGSKLINNISIGNNSLVGLGTNVLKSFPQESKIVGNPARAI